MHAARRADSAIDELKPAAEPRTFEAQPAAEAPISFIHTFWRYASTFLSRSSSANFVECAATSSSNFPRSAV